MEESDPRPQTEPEPPVSAGRWDVEPDRRRLFDLDPVLALHSGPWKFGNRPRAGLVLKVMGIVLTAALVAGVIVMRLTAPREFEGFAAYALAGAVIFLVLVVFWGCGSLLADGSVRHAASGRSMVSRTEKYRCTTATADYIRARMAQGDLDSVHLGNRMFLDKPATGVLTFTVYALPGKHEALACMHFTRKDAPEEPLIWPPMPTDQEFMDRFFPRRSENIYDFNN